MPPSDYERAMAEGALRSRTAAGAASAPPRLPARADQWSAPGGFGTRLRDLWERRRRLLIGIGLFLLFDLIAALAAVTMGTHF